MGTIARPPLWQMIGIELLVVTALAAAVLPAGVVQSYSLLAGGLIQVVSTAYFSLLAFRYRGARQMGRALHSMYRGETGKVILSALFFIAVFIFVKPLGVAAFFCGYVAMVLVHLVVATKMLQHHDP